MTVGFILGLAPKLGCTQLSGKSGRQKGPDRPAIGATRLFHTPVEPGSAALS